MDRSLVSFVAVWVWYLFKECHRDLKRMGLGDFFRKTGSVYGWTYLQSEENLIPWNHRSSNKFKSQPDYRPELHCLQSGSRMSIDLGSIEQFENSFEYRESIRRKVLGKANSRYNDFTWGGSLRNLVVNQSFIRVSTFNENKGCSWP